MLATPPRLAIAQPNVLHQKLSDTRYNQKKKILGDIPPDPPRGAGNKLEMYPPRGPDLPIQYNTTDSAETDNN